MIGKVRSGFNRLWGSLAKTRDKLHSICQYFWHTFRIWLWYLQFKARTRFFRSAALVLLLASSIVVVEAGLGVLRNIGLLGWEPLHLPLWIEIVVLGFAVVLARHYVHEWKLSLREMEVPKRVNSLLSGCSGFLSSTSHTDQARKSYLDAAMYEFKGLFEVESRRQITLSIMGERDGQLVTIFVHPLGRALKEDLDLELPLDNSAAGLAYKERKLVYVPSTKHEGAIDADSPKVLGLQYLLVGHEERFRSMLCVPVVSGSGATLVLNVMSSKRGSFSIVDFDIAKLLGTFIAMAD